MYVMIYAVWSSVKLLGFSRTSRKMYVYEATVAIEKHKKLSLEKNVCGKLGPQILFHLAFSQGSTIS